MARPAPQAMMAPVKQEVEVIVLSERWGVLTQHGVERRRLRASQGRLGRLTVSAAKAPTNDAIPFGRNSIVELAIGSFHDDSSRGTVEVNFSAHVDTDEVLADLNESSTHTQVGEDDFDWSENEHVPLEAPGGTVPIIQSLLRRLTDTIDAVGGLQEFAEIFEFEPEELEMWVSGLSMPAPEKIVSLLDVDYVLTRARLIWSGAVAITWLESENSYLEGAYPIDVLLSEGPVRVIEALELAASGAFL
jgi:hypothetical protein